MALLNIIGNVIGANKGALLNLNAPELSDIANVGHYVFNDPSTVIQSTDKVYQLRDLTQGNAFSSDLITNQADREFSADTGFWTKAANMTILDGKVNFNGVSAYTGLYKGNLIPSPLSVYKVEFDVDSISGSNIAVAFGAQSWYAFTTAQRFSKEIISPASGTQFTIRP